MAFESLQFALWSRIVATMSLIVASFLDEVMCAHDHAMGHVAHIDVRKCKCKAMQLMSSSCRVCIRKCEDT